MRYVAAYLLAVLGGNASPSASDIKAILGSVGIEADDERLNKVPNLSLKDYIYSISFYKPCIVDVLFVILVQVISELNGKDINEVMNAGKSLSSLHQSIHLTLQCNITNHLLSLLCVCLFSSSYSGLSKLASVPAGGAVAAPAAAGGAAAGGAAPAAGVYLLSLT